MTANTNCMVSLFEKYCGHMTVAELFAEGLINCGILAEVVEERLRGGKRHAKVNEKGSDIVMPDGSLVEVKYVKLLTRLVKAKNALREARKATINRLATKSKCRLVVYVHDVDNNRMIRFELAEGWETQIKISLSAKGGGSTSVYAPVGIDLLKHEGAGIFRSDLHHVKPVIIK